MAAVAERLMLRALASAEPNLLVGSGLPFLRPEFGALVRAIAKRLRFRAPAGAPPIAFAGDDIDGQRPPATDFGFTHALFPPPSVASHAAPHAFASSRTRKI